MEVVREAKVLMVHMKCSKCGEGLMQLSKIDTDVFKPTTYLHKCSNCGHEETYNVKYPDIRVVPIEPYREPTESEKV